MNWITRCPECLTVYQVLPDQLKQAKGWLRCGHCSHIFDSTGRVLSWQGGVDSLPVVRPTPEVALSVTTSKPTFQSATIQTPELKNDPVMTASAVVAPLDTGLRTDTENSDEPIAPPSDVAEHLFNPLAVSESRGEQPIVVPVQRGPWRALSLSLALILCLQLVWIQRDALAAQFPLLAQSFQSVCQLTGCESAVLRNPDAMVIDSSSFVKQKDGFVLHWTVRNSSHQTLGMTALELSLKDGQDSDLVRKVLLPKDMEAPSTIAAGQTWSGMLILGVSDNLPVVGYRVLSFYP
ncbi:hypothetical protein H663_007070 [Limnohabitans planktonicus II-D5]|uniref:Zinc finger/thioredoxin putative domain-containing protein n=2 Tax=Limnohabitans planktonicus TaxID=540060 RepID=A0A2T7UFA0_9BURK|nr:hypothetical protein H663_007070 [Limnohabitans planktonicus II-D5]|eukprot:gene23643-29884_t